MSIIPQLLPLEFNSHNIKQKVLTNILKMLCNRHIVNKENYDSYLKNVLSQDSDDNVYKIKLDKPELYYGKLTDKTYYVKLLNQKITGISKTSNIGDFIYPRKNQPKLIVVSSASSKAVQQLKEEFLHSEVFTQDELMIDIVSHIIVPIHEILSEEETKIFLEDYLLKKRGIPKIFINDPVCKYYNGKVGQIFRIIRPSEASGQSIYYRIVVNVSLSDEKK
jgi:DNA-directed RNA polymerase subunit H (RpoH/RPB5)